MENIFKFNNLPIQSVVAIIMMTMIMVVLHSIFQYNVPNVACVNMSTFSY